MSELPLPRDLMQCRAPYEIRDDAVWHSGRNERVCGTDALLAMAIVPDGGTIFKAGHSPDVEAFAVRARPLTGELRVVSFPVTPETVALLNWTCTRTGAELEYYLRLLTEQPGNEHVTVALAA